MRAKILFFQFISYLVLGYVSTISYDQRQTGEFNVQVEVKDVQIIALMNGGKEEYVDYDYAYDYSEMTIKPQNRTTPKPFNGTSVTTDYLKDKTTIASTALPDHTTSIASNKTSSVTSNATISEYTTTSNSTVEVEKVTESTYYTTADKKNSTTTTESTSNETCKKGFVLNHKGECELKLQGTGNALIKLVKLSQKLKLRRENKRYIED